MKRVTLEQLIRDTDSLTMLNAIKTALGELKEELAILEETREFQNLAIERAKKTMRRIDNLYRGIVKSTAKIYQPTPIDIAPNLGLELDKEDEDGSR